MALCCQKQVHIIWKDRLGQFITRITCYVIYVMFLRGTIARKYSFRIEYSTIGILQLHSNSMECYPSMFSDLATRSRELSVTCECRLCRRSHEKEQENCTKIEWNSEVFRSYRARRVVGLSGRCVLGGTLDNSKRVLAKFADEKETYLAVLEERAARSRDSRSGFRTCRRRNFPP